MRRAFAVSLAVLGCCAYDPLGPGGEPLADDAADAGSFEDAGVIVDPLADAGDSLDAGDSVDAGDAPDAGPEDAGAKADAGPADAGCVDRSSAAALCARAGFDCDVAEVVDACGVVQHPSCGSCSRTLESCGAGGRPNVCDCDPELASNWRSAVLGASQNLGPARVTPFVTADGVLTAYASNGAGMWAEWASGAGFSSHQLEVGSTGSLVAGPTLVERTDGSQLAFWVDSDQRAVLSSRPDAGISTPWTARVLEQRQRAYRQPRLVLAADGTAWVSWSTQVVATGLDTQVNLARLTPAGVLTSWSSAGTANTFSLRLDAAGKPHLLGATASSSTYTYWSPATATGGALTAESVGTAGATAALAVDSEGVPVAFAASAGTLTLLRRTAPGVWSANPLSLPQALADHTVTDAAFDAHGGLHIVMSSSGGVVTYLRRTSSDWLMHELPNRSTSQPSLALGPGKGVNLAYVTQPEGRIDYERLCR